MADVLIREMSEKFEIKPSRRILKGVAEIGII
jgi:hypothetical protein